MIIYKLSFGLQLCWLFMLAGCHSENIPQWNARDVAMLSHSVYSKCHPIPQNMTLCYAIGYEQMRLPNLLNHETVTEAVQQSNIWNLLAKTDCHLDLKLFLCSLYAPVCLKEHYDRQIKPCRSLCSAVKTSCLPRMQAFGYEWPDIARCDKFPDANSMCVPPRDNSEVVCEPCKQAVIYENVISSYCMADLVIRSKIESQKLTSGGIVLTLANTKKILKNSKQDLISQGISARKLNVQISISNKCYCPNVTRNSSTVYLIMAQQLGNLNQVSFINKFDRENSVYRKALKALRQDASTCSSRGNKQAKLMDGFDINSGRENFILDTNNTNIMEVDEQTSNNKIKQRKKKNKKNKKRQKQKQQRTNEAELSFINL